jgi:hypothetical protein
MYDTTLGVDPFGGLHVTYVAHDGVSLVLRHASRAAAETAWHVATIDGAQDYLIGQAIDSAGGIHVSYVASDHSLGYAHLAPAGIWSTATVASFSWNSTITVDGTGLVSVLYHYGDNALWNADAVPGGGWTLSRVMVGSVPGLQASVAVGPGGPVLALGYVSGDAYELALAKRGPDAAGWSVTPADSSGGKYPAVAIDGGGNVHVAYGSSSQQLYLRRDTSGAMATTTIDFGPGAGRYNGIAVDAAGGIHISGYNSQNLDVWVNHVRADGQFTSQLVENVGTIAGRTALASDRAGGLWLSFPNGNTNELRVAHLCPNTAP